MQEEFEHKIVKRRETSHNSLMAAIQKAEEGVLSLLSRERQERLEIEEKMIDTATAKLANV